MILVKHYLHWSSSLICGVLCIAIVTIYTPTECFGSDRGATPIEIDTRNEAELLKDVQSKMLVGTWYSLKEGLAPTIITKTHISDLGCKTPYVVVQKSVGKSYPDKIPSFETGRAELDVGRFVTIKIRIQHKECKRAIQSGFLQFSFLTTDPQYSFASVVQYDDENHPQAWYDLIKR